MDLNTVDITKISSTAFAENSKATNVALLYLLQQQQFSPAQTELVTSLSQNFEVLEVKLGEELATYSGTLNNSLPQDFFLVCEGRLRLLGFDVDKQREVSTNVISEGAICGGECLGTENALPYRLIAASDSRIAKITAAKLKSGLEKLPELKQKWQIETQQYQKLIFFKTLTELRSLASHRLKQLLPYLVEQKVKARAQIDTEGCTRFWLREGQFEGQAVSIGDSKTCSAAAAWVAQTNLTIYQLPQKNWQVFAELAPELATAWSTDSRLQSEEKMTVKSNHREVNALANINHTSVALSYHADPDNSQETANQQLQKVDYPQPIKRRRVLWRTYPYIEQQSSSDCGAACLAMISRYWGKRVSINYLRKLIGIGRSGSSLKSMAKAAESLGYHARPVRASLSRIVQQQNPWIAHWEGDHYVVVYRLKGDRLLVADPASGIRQIGRTEFLAGWTGYALLLDPTENLYQAPTEKRSLSRFFYLLLPYRSLGVTIILASVLIQILGVISPLFTQIILDRVVVNRSQSTLNVLIIGMLMFGALNIGLSSVRSYLLSYLANRLDLTMIGGFVNHALNLPLKFFESRRVGDIITRVQENQKIQQFLIQNVMLSCQEIQP
ncbi:MAG: cysteine peptidase family C39 domain-containing protein, partial [Cyanobacteria bacterium J06629_2]